MSILLILLSPGPGCHMDNIDEVTEKRLKALKEIEKDKFRGGQNLQQEGKN